MSRTIPVAVASEGDKGDEKEGMEDLTVSFGYQCGGGHASTQGSSETATMLSISSSKTIPPCSISSSDSGSSGSSSSSSNGSTGSWKRVRTSGSFSFLSGAALSANATLANTCLCNGVLRQEILPSLDSPRVFRQLKRSASFSHSTPSSLNLPFSTPTFLNASDAQAAGGAAGEDRVQAVCSEENGWLFCAIYDGFNGRDAADFLAGTLYRNIASHIRSLEQIDPAPPEAMLKCLNRALSQTESDFIDMVGQEVRDRPDLAMVGSCVLVSLLIGQDLYVLSLGDSRAVLATQGLLRNGSSLHATQLTVAHTVDDRAERDRVLAEHPEDPSAISSARLKGKLKLTRAFGAGYLKKSDLNNALMGILRVRDLSSPPYLSTRPSVCMHRVSEVDRFVVLGSDGLFDFFGNQEVVELVDRYIVENPTSDPAKYMLEQLLSRAASNAAMTVEELKRVPYGRRRKYHDDVTIIVIMLQGEGYQTCSASTLT